MTEQDIFENLCTYDPRNPLYDPYWTEDIHTGKPREPRIGCYCDNCFYGRDKLALELLNVIAKAEDQRP